MKNQTIEDYMKSKKIHPESYQDYYTISKTLDFKIFVFKESLKRIIKKCEDLKKNYLDG
tara:strand:+ start:244 stop:420 length:177 start_codon:yes stop_codon:yes gene_type:complete